MHERGAHVELFGTAVGIASKLSCTVPKISRTLTTADHLHGAVFRNEFPSDHQTCIDFGFRNAATPEARTYLLVWSNISV